MIAIELRDTVVTEMFFDPDIELSVAVMVDVPLATLKISPDVLTVTNPCAEELQDTVLETSCVVPSLNEPEAVNCSDIPWAIVTFGAPIVIETREAEVTVTFVEPEIAPEAALIVAEPGARPITLPEVLTLAVMGVEELH